MSQQQEKSVDLQDMLQTNAAPNVKKHFSVSVSTKTDFSGFEACPPRTNREHRQQAPEIINHLHYFHVGYQSIGTSCSFMLCSRCDFCFLEEYASLYLFIYFFCD